MDIYRSIWLSAIRICKAGTDRLYSRYLYQKTPKPEYDQGTCKDAPASAHNDRVDRNRELEYGDHLFWDRDVASPKNWHFILMGVLGILMCVVFIATAGYRADRIRIWLAPEKYDDGYQTMQSLYAIGSGGFFGRGLGNSIQKMGFIPESHNDMIFSVICEELGLFGAVLTIIMFILLIYRCTVLAINSGDRFGGLIAVGVMAHIAVQILINISVVTNTIPPTGVPLPFISYGGSSIFFLLLEMGLMFAVARQIKPGR